jgi:hypothetical protein
LAGFSESNIQLLNEEVTVPVISDPNNGVAVLDLEEARCTTLELLVAGC